MVWGGMGIAEERHHWVIEPADGPLSKGVCQKCGEVKTFTNYVERHYWSQGKAAPGISQAPDVEGSETGDGTSC